MPGALEGGCALLEQIMVTGKLEALSSLHIGTGESEPLASLRDRKKDEIPLAILEDPAGEEKLASLVAKVVRDFEKRPCIPGTTLKGCVRSACREAGFAPELLKNIFGEITDHPESRAEEDDENEKGWMGSLRFLLCRLEPDSVPQGLHLPFYLASKASYILTRVAIDRDTGTAEANKLFNQEMVPEGTRFGFRLHFSGDEADFRQSVMPVLNLMASEAGIPLGKGQGLGQGRVRLLQDELKARHTWFDAAKFSQDAKDLPLVLQPGARPEAKVTRKLRLTCRGPYLTHDPCRAGKKKDPKAKESKEPAIQGLQSSPGKPLLLPSSLLGVLRSRMAWLQAVDRQDIGLESERIDNRFRRPDWQNPEKLTATERLFGVTGWRKLVEVEAVDLVKGGAECDLTSVALDRFSAAPIDNALFTTRAYHGVEFVVTLSLGRRFFLMPGDDEATPFGNGNLDDEEAFNALIAQVLEDEVLMLGHGVNKGFGWFKVEEVVNHG